LRFVDYPYWTLLIRQSHNQDGEYNIEIDGNTSVNNGEMVCQMAVNGVGIAYLPDFFC